MGDQICTVARGTELLKLSTMLCELKSVATSDETEDRREQLIFLSQNLKLDYKYTGNDFCNSFHVDKQIMLVGAGFFGPSSKHSKQEGVKYMVRIRLDKLYINERKKVKKDTLASIDKEVIGFCGEIFNVDFETPILLEPSAMKYTLAFKLMGPPTLGLDPTKLQTRVKSEGVTFYFWPGSQQMPIIRFQKIY